MRRVLIVDDEALTAMLMADVVVDIGHESVSASTVADGKRLIEEQDFDYYLFDVNIGGQISIDTLWRATRKKFPTVPIIFYSGYAASDLKGFVGSDANTHFLLKPVAPEEFQRLVRSFEFGLKSLNIFIVHGRDHEALGQMEVFLRDRLGHDKPHILARSFGANATFIEKLEQAKDSADACLVLITPDDVNVPAPRARTKRMRQNVLFELGFFMGAFGRKSGRVIVFTIGDVEIPSDLAGVDFVRVTDGFAAITDDIVDEIRRRLLRRREA